MEFHFAGFGVSPQVRVCTLATEREQSLVPLAGCAVSGGIAGQRFSFHLRKPIPLMAAASIKPVEPPSGTAGGGGAACKLPTRLK
jgi:hypothetical protein